MLVGWSYGAFVICDYVRSYGQDRIAAINFVGGAVKLGEAAFGTLTRPWLSRPLRRRDGQDLPTNIRAMRGLVRAFAATPLPAADVETLLSASMTVPAQSAPTSPPARSTATTCSARSRCRCWSRTGREDTVVLPAMAEHVLATCPTAEASWYDGVAHVPHLEEPERFNRELAALTRRVGA